MDELGEDELDEGAKTVERSLDDLKRYHFLSSKISHLGRGSASRSASSKTTGTLAQQIIITFIGLEEVPTLARLRD